MLELIDKQQLIFQIKKSEFKFVKPYYLLIGWELKKAKVSGSTLIWNIENTKIRYNQIKGIALNSKFKHIDTITC